MSRWLITPAVMLLLLSSCGEDIDPKEAAIQREVAKRVETLRKEMKDDQDRRHTIRVVFCCLVIAGALICVVRIHAGRRSNATVHPWPPPEPTTRSRPFRTRIIEPPTRPRRPFGT